MAELLPSWDRRQAWSRWKVKVGLSGGQQEWLCASKDLSYLLDPEQVTCPFCPHLLPALLGFYSPFFLLSVARKDEGLTGRPAHLMPPSWRETEGSVVFCLA
jgi:hypothetical protein